MMIGILLGWMVYEVILKEWNEDDFGKRRWWMFDGGENVLLLWMFLVMILVFICIIRDFRKVYMMCI